MSNIKNSNYQKNKEAILAKNREIRENKNENGEYIVSIYRIFNSDGKSYIGSTRLKPEKRVRLHVLAYSSYTRGMAKFCASFDILKNEGWKWEVLCTCSIGERDERESHYMYRFDCVNKNKANQRVKDNRRLYFQNWKLRDGNFLMNQELKNLGRIEVM